MDKELEPNWTALYKRLQKLGPLMLEGVPEEYEWWIEEMSVTTDKFWPSTQEVFYTRWGWSNKLEDRNDAVLATLKQWASNVKQELDYMLDIYEESPQKIRKLRSQVTKMKLKPKPEFLQELLACAMLPLDANLEDLEEELPVEYLPFELLPSGSSGLGDLISHLRREISEQSPGYTERAIDESRITQIKSLEPDKCYIGTEKWRGYVLFEFQFKEKVVLECPAEGNATYILSGDWKELVQHSKYYLRKNYPDRCVRVIHKGDWLDRVRAALRN